MSTATRNALLDMWHDKVLSTEALFRLGINPYKYTRVKE